MHYFDAFVSFTTSSILCACESMYMWEPMCVKDVEAQVNRCMKKL
jgi:hypothetical protein